MSRWIQTAGRSIRKIWHRVILCPPLVRIYDRHRKETLGQFGERVAVRHLLRTGFLVIEQNYSDKLGEIDLIAVDDATPNRTIVFIEVKTRATDHAGLPAEAVDERKQAKIARTATGYLKRNQLIEHAVRFDVIAILCPDPSAQPVVQHYRAAFETPGEFQMF